MNNQWTNFRNMTDDELISHLGNNWQPEIVELINRLIDTTEIDDLLDKVKRLNTENGYLNAELDNASELNAEIRELQSRLDVFEKKHSWKITKVEIK